MKQPIPLLIDTDIGDDIDDALAIALALKSPELNIIGITTVFKNTQARANLVNSLTTIFGRKDIPVFMGIGTPLVNHVDTTEIPCQCTKTESYIHNSDMHAVNFIIECAKTIPNLHIAAIGPLTNLAVATLLYPDIIKNVNIVLMGGAYGITEAEWNIFCDPEAARIVFESGANIKAIGLDVTTQCVLSNRHETAIKRNSSTEAQYLNYLINAWKNFSGYGVTLHDPLVIGYLLQPDLLSFEKKKIVVELCGNITRGATIVKQSFFLSKTEEPNVEIATKVNSQEMVSLFLNRVFNIF